jgi:hypothetical protein
MSQNHEAKYKLYGYRLQIGASEGLDPITGFGPGGKFGSVPDIARGSLLLDNPVTGLNTNGLRSSSMPGLVQDRLRSSLPSKITGLGEVNAVRGTSVLGKYPDYLNLTDQIGAKRFNVPTNIWNKMSAAEQWSANQKFLDRMIIRGDKIILSNPVLDINKVSGAFRQELDYLIGKGYRLNSMGNQLIK